ncbi:MAG: YggS family pyridoxal phosphate-dependent enzyme [Verrucomicrobia bacterium]|nr:MAG: YggS family pyridoxal phosphate-dependent enzyme [Verrucomicrobiota bacterium]
MRNSQQSRSANIFPGGFCSLFARNCFYCTTERSPKNVNKTSANLVNIREKIAEAACRAGRRPAEITLVAVSKTQSVEKIREAADAGQRVFGENRVQEALEKGPALPQGLSWHLIGHLQTNKIRKALNFFELIHGVDSVHLTQAIDRIAAEMKLCPSILLEVNVSGENSKFGFAPASLRASIEELMALQHVRIEGLMTVAPLNSNPESSRVYFAQLREMRDQLTQRTHLPLPILSMGMSGDYEVAVEEGATLVRVGSALFGERRYV